MINVHQVSKNFIVRERKNSSLEFLASIFTKTNKKVFCALEDITFSLEDGEVLGILGRNGAGKSTLLRVIAGILKQTSGTVECAGDVVYISGFSNGMNRNLSMIDNIYLIGTLNGLSKTEINNKVDEIVDFSDLEDFLFTPLYQFSTGMLARLTFSISLFTLPTAPDILLLDEAIGAGSDESFREKLVQKIEEYINSAKTVIIVSHNKHYLLENCDKIMWLHKGKKKMCGDPDEVITAYSEFVK
jgi:ABC-type polysaccharide/polyol phosphate transport system ATPase subunit